jgi:hypothetical protein
VLSRPRRARRLAGRAPGAESEYDATMIFGMDVLVVLIVVLVIVLIWRGPKTLPALGAMFGRGVKSMRHEVEGKLDDDEPKPQG